MFAFRLTYGNSERNHIVIVSLLISTHYVLIASLRKIVVHISCYRSEQIYDNVMVNLQKNDNP